MSTPKPPGKPQPKLRKADLDAIDHVAGLPIVAAPADPRQAGHFDLPLPGWMRPCLPTLVEKPPAGPQWFHEINWDGCRVSAYVEAGKISIRTRNGHDWTKRFPATARAIAGLYTYDERRLIYVGMRCGARPAQAHQAALSRRQVTRRFVEQRPVYEAAR